jgi:hypothetical protein
MTGRKAALRCAARSPPCRFQGPTTGNERITHNAQCAGLCNMSGRSLATMPRDVVCVYRYGRID